MNDSLIEYYVNLLIIQYNDKPKARATIGLFIVELMIYDIAISIRDGFDIESAVGAQLDILGKYLGASRIITGTAFTREYFGMVEYGEIPPYPNDPAGTLYRSNFASGVDGWIPYEECSFSTENNKLKITTSGTDPIINKPFTDSVKGKYLRLKLSGDYYYQFCLLYYTDGSYEDVELTSINGNTFSGTIPNTTGKSVSKLRLDLAIASGRILFLDDIYIGTGAYLPFRMPGYITYSQIVPDVQFRSYKESSQSLYSLNDTEYRMILKLKIVQNNAIPSVMLIDDIMSQLFGASVIFTDRLNMSIGYTFPESMTRLAQIAKSEDLLPRPSAVGVSLSFTRDINNIFSYSTYGGNHPTFAVGYSQYGITPIGGMSYYG